MNDRQRPRAVTRTHATSRLAQSGTSWTHIERAWNDNPFDSNLAKAHSSYAAYDGQSLVRLLETAGCKPFERTVHAAFREFVAEPTFSCLGARAALQRGTYRFGAYRKLDSPDASAGLARDLYAFAMERKGFESTFTTYVAAFAGFDIDGDPDVSFERALWNQLARLHVLDREHHTWDERVSAEPSDPKFSYSFAGTGFFVVGLHPGSTRSARRFSWPTLVFNAHEQFEELRESGRFDGLQARIRQRELLLDGSLNPNLAAYGEDSEARQYAGRPLPKDWQCPFRPN